MATRAKIEETTEAEAAPPPPKKKPFKLILIIVVVLLSVGAGAAFAWFKFMTPHKVEAKNEAKAGESKGDGKAGEGAHGEKSGEKGAESTPGKMGPIFDLDPFIVNLADTDPRFLKLTMKFELDASPLKTEMTERMPQVRDAVLILLSSKDSLALKPTAGKLQLRDEVIQRVNTLLAGGQVKNVYFTEFVVQ